MKKVISIAIVCVLVLTVGVMAAGCKSSKGGESEKKSYGDEIPGGTADVSAEVLEALTKSGEISMYDFGTEDPESESGKWKAGFDEYYAEIYGGKVTRKYRVWEGWEDGYLTDYAANDAPDLIYLFEKNWPKLANRGMVYSIKEMKDMGVVGFDHPLLTADLDLVSTYYKYKGELYTFATCMAEADMLFVDEDIFKNKGVKSPSQYYEEGLWNWDTFMQCAIAVTEDTNGDGATDMYGYGGWDGNFIVTAAGGELVKLGEDGKLSVGLDDLATIQGLENFRQLIGVDKAGLTTDTMFGKNVAMKAWMPQNEYKAISNGDYKFKWSILPFPLDTKTNKTGVRSGKSYAWCVSTSCENPQGCINYMIANRAYNAKNPSPSTRDYHDIFTDEQIEMINDCTRNANVPIYQGVGTLWHSQWDFWTNLKGGRRAVSEVIGTYRSLFEAQVTLENSSATN